MINFYDRDWMNTGFLWEENMTDERLALHYSSPAHGKKEKENRKKENAVPVKHSNPIRIIRKQAKFLFNKIKRARHSA